MSEELLKIADGLLAVSEGVRALAGKAHSCNCSKNQEEERGQKDEESGNEKSQEKQEDAVTIEQRRNERCQMTHAPKRYWKDMCEMALLGRGTAGKAEQNAEAAR